MTTKKHVKAGIIAKKEGPRGANRFIGRVTRGILGGVLLVFVGISPSLHAEPTAAEILQGVRINQGSQHRALRGQLRTESARIPFRLVLNGPEIRYEFTNPKQILVLKMGEEASRFEEITSEGAERVSSARMDDPVRNSDVTYEDLALRFLYWKNARVLKEETISGFRCYKLELHPERGSGSQYGTVWAWIGINSGALAKAECYAPNGTLAARFTVVSGRPLSDGSWIFKQMRLERMTDGKAKDTAPTYLEILGEE